MAENYSTSSGRQTASAQVSVVPSAVVSVIAEADGTNAATITVWDSENSTTTGKTMLVKIVVDAGLTFEMFHSDRPVCANRGIYLEVSGTGAAAIVHYLPA